MLGLGRDILRLVSTGVTGGGGGPALGYTPPLDSIDSVAAYSVRKMRTDYSGACIEAYRVSDGATQDIGFDGDGLINTADIISFASGSQVLVRTWYNQGTSGPDAVSLIGEYPEIYDGTSIRMMNGRPCLFPQNTAVGFTDIPINIGDLQPLPWTRWTAFSVSKANTNLGVFALFNQSPNVRVNLVTPFVPTSNDGALQGIAIDTTGTGGIYYQGVDKGSFTTRETTLDQFLDFQTISNIVGLETNGSQSTYNDMTLGGTSFFAGYAMHIMQEVVIIPSLSQPSYDQALDVNANQYYQVTNLPDYTSGFLADYPDAAAAYSVRKLSNTAIKCMRVRRAVAPFDEKDIGFTAGGDLDEAAIVAFGGSDVLTVSAWYDQSGQSRHAIQINPNSQPQIYNGTAVITENGKPALDCDGNGADHFTLTTGLGDVTLYTILAVLEDGIRNPVSGEGSMLFADGTSDWIWYNNVSTVNVDATGSSKNISTTWSTSQRLDYHSLVSGTAYFGSDGATLDSVTGVTGGVPINYLLGHYGTLGNYNYNGKAQEIIIWESDQDAAGNRTAIETNINDYYTVSPNGDAPTSGFLFDYSGATFAYSIRQLNDNADYCMQVIRADGVTLSIGFDGSGYVDTAAIVSFAAGQKVYLNRMYDQTGNRYHSGTVSALPGVRLVVVYDGTNLITKNGQLMPQMDLLSSASSSSMVSPTGTALGVTHSLYAVVQRPSTPSALNMFSSNAGVTALYQERSGNLTYGPGWTSFGIYTYPTVSNEPRLYSYIRKNGTDGECFNDGVSQGTTTAMTAATSVNISGYRFDKTQTGIQADCSGFQEMIAYTADRTAVGDNANILANIKAYYPSIP